MREKRITLHAVQQGMYYLVSSSRESSKRGDRFTGSVLNARNLRRLRKGRKGRKGRNERFNRKDLTNAG